MESDRFTRLTSSDVLVQVHVSPNSRYLILPVLERASVITGWLVYDTEKGRIVEPDDIDCEVTPEESKTYYTEGKESWPRLHQAREWVSRIMRGGST